MWTRQQPLSRSRFRFGFGAAEFNPNIIAGLQEWALSTAPYYYGTLNGLEVLDSKQNHGTQRAPRQGRAFQFDGVNDVLVGSSVTGTTIVTKTGTATLTVGVGQITATVGTLSYFELSNGSFYYCNQESGTIVYDASGNGRHLTLANITPSAFHAIDTSVTSNPANSLGYTSALSGNGTDVYASRSGLPSTLFSGSWTVAFELYEVPASGSLYLINRNTSSPVFAVFTNKLSIGTGSGWRECNFSSGSWMVTHDTLQTGFDRVSIYKDGVLQTMTNNTTWTNIPADSSVVNIFRRTNNSFYTNGKMPRIRMWSSVKTPAEVAANDPANSVFDLQEFGNNVWLDSSSNQNDFAVLGTNPVAVVPRNEGNTALDVLGGSLKYTGQCPFPMVIETPCITGNGTNVYADLGTLNLTGNYDIDFKAKFGSFSVLQAIAGHWNGGVGWLILLVSATELLIYRNNSIITVNPSLVAGVWNKFKVSWIGTTAQVLLNDIPLTITGSFAASTNTLPASTPALMSYSAAAATNTMNGSLSDFQVTTGGVTTYFPLQEGAGSSNTNRDLYFIKSDNTYGVVTSALINGTVADIWANRTIGNVQDWCANYGGKLAANGCFVPATLNSIICADGGALTLFAGKHGNPYSRLNANPFSAAEYNGRSIPTAYAPAGGWNGVITPTNTGFRRTASGGDDRFLVYEDTLTGADLTNVQTYTA